MTEKERERETCGTKRKMKEREKQEQERERKFNFLVTFLLSFVHYQSFSKKNDRKKESYVC